MSDLISREALLEKIKIRIPHISVLKRKMEGEVNDTYLSEKAEW